jgi:hypothetical protein
MGCRGWWLDASEKSVDCWEFKVKLCTLLDLMVKKQIHHGGEIYYFSILNATCLYPTFLNQCSQASWIYGFREATMWPFTNSEYDLVIASVNIRNLGWNGNKRDLVLSTFSRSSSYCCKELTKKWKIVLGIR